MSYTKGPWEARFVPDAMPADVCNYGVVGRDGIEVCRCWTEESARFIEAGPDIYEALEWYKQTSSMLFCLYVEQETSNPSLVNPSRLGEMWLINGKACEMVDKALAKARGES